MEVIKFQFKFHWNLCPPSTEAGGWPEAGRKADFSLPTNFVGYWSDTFQFVTQRWCCYVTSRSVIGSTGRWSDSSKTLVGHWQDIFIWTSSELIRVMADKDRKVTGHTGHLPVAKQTDPSLVGGWQDDHRYDGGHLVGSSSLILILTRTWSVVSRRATD